MPQVIQISAICKSSWSPGKSLSSVAKGITTLERYCPESAISIMRWGFFLISRPDAGRSDYPQLIGQHLDFPEHFLDIYLLAGYYIA